MAFHNPIALAFWAGTWPEALDAAKQRQQQPGSTFEHAIAHGWYARIACAICSVDLAYKHAKIALESFEAPLSHIAMAESAIANGQLTLAYSHAETAWKQAEEMDAITKTAALTTFAMVEGARGHGEAAYGKAFRASIVCPEEAPFLLSEAQMSIAYAAMSIQRLDEAEEAVFKAMSLRKSQSETSPWIAECYDALGRIKRHQKRPFDAVDFHKKALAMWSSDSTFYQGPMAASHHGLAPVSYTHLTLPTIYSV